MRCQSQSTSKKDSLKADLVRKFKFLKFNNKVLENDMAMTFGLPQ